MFCLNDINASLIKRMAGMSLFQKGKEIFKLHIRQQLGYLSLLPLYRAQQVKDCLFLNLFKTTVVMVWLNTWNLDCDSGIHSFLIPFILYGGLRKGYFFKVGRLSWEKLNDHVLPCLVGAVVGDTLGVLMWPLLALLSVAQFTAVHFTLHGDPLVPLPRARDCGQSLAFSGSS